MNIEISIENLQRENRELQNTVAILQEQIAWFKRNIFGQRSEKILLNRDQLEFANLEYNQNEVSEAIVPAKPEKKIRIPTGKDKISWPSDIPVERVFLDIPEEQKISQETGLSLVKIGEEVTTKLAHKPGSYFIKEIVRPKYAEPKNSENGIKIAELPESLLTRCQADESLLADILVKKFVDHLPLYRISEIYARQEIFIPRQILSSWVLKSANALKPLFNLMKQSILDSDNVFIDETPIKMLEAGKGKTHQAYMWVMCGGKQADPPYRIYNFRTNRQHHHATDLLKNYSGILHSDKYGAYEELAKTKQFTWCPCWAHIRRKFIDSELGDTSFRDWVLTKIQELFKIEERAWLVSLEERLEIRKEEEIPIIDELIEAIKNKLINGKVLPKTKFREALGYFCSLIPYLKNYTLYPWARMDNNVSERAVRPLAIGRKNWLFVGSEEGGEAAAIIYSLVQTCKALKINPYEYLEDVMRRIMSHNSQKLEELLPDQWVKKIKS